MNRELKKILFVEDEEDIRTIAKIALENIGGFEVQYSANGEEALSILKEFVPDLIIMDVMMPGMDGMTTLQEIQKKNNLKHIPIIFMTARVQTREIAAYREMGALDVIIKPFDPMTLPAQVKKIWNSQ